MNVSFTEKQTKYIESQLESGDFKNASEVVRDAIRLHQLYRQKIIDDLRSEISEAWDGPTTSIKPSEIARRKFEEIKQTTNNAL